MKRILSALLLAGAFTSASAQSQKIESFRYAGPYTITQPVMIDSVTFDNKKFDTKSLLSSALNLEIAKKATQSVDSILPTNNGEKPTLNLLYTTVSNTSFAKAKINVSKLKNYKLFVDDKEQQSGAELTLSPRTHEVVIKYLAMPNEADTAIVNIESKSDISIAPTVKGQNGQGSATYFAEAGVKAKGSYYIKPSNDGLYYIQIDRQRFPDNSTTWTYLLKETKSNRIVLSSTKSISWTPSAQHTFYKYNDTKEGKQLVFVDAKTLQETVVCKNMPKEQVTILPNHKQAIVHKQTEGPKADNDKHLYLHPEDRVPGWRDRTQLELFDFETGLTTPITYGNRALWLNDISRDSRHIILAVSTEEIETMRPTLFYTLLRLDLQTMKADTLIAKDGFFAGSKLSPDGKKLAIKASPEFADRIGCVLPKDKYPNIYDYQLYILDIDKAIAKEQNAIVPVTKDFNPTIEDYEWSAYDNNIYFSAQDKDYIRLYQLDTKSNKIKQADIPSDCINRYYLADNAPLIGIGASGLVDFGKTYWLNTKTLKTTLIEDVHKRELSDYAMPTCHDFNFTNSNGDEITGCYLLPPGFDEQKAEKGKYPLLVYYYGGCSPVSRYFSTSYSFPALASQGYIVYILQPRGCSGFGQEFAAWHGNTAGDPQTQDIIEGTKAFCAAHPYVNEKKMGSFGASYGGFMTMYLQTKTDMFSAAWSHAGISNHTSYWGFGYWGYTYSQVSMPGTYPWTHKELYVDRSPLFNVQKIKTPLLFTHGTDDRNVPPIESSQMFTALRLLGQPTAYVTFQKEGHHVENYSRLLNWQNTFMAWFAKWLKDDGQWWEEMYPETKNKL